MSEVHGRAGLREDAPPQKVLVVDDEAVLRDVLCKLLAQPRRVLVGAASAEEALATAADGSFCAALVDKNLVGTSGVKLARTLRKRHPELEVILMSGYASIESALEAVQIGAFDYVTKPIDDYASLSLKLQNAVDKSLLVRRHRELMRQLFDSELRYRTLFEATPDALLVYDDSLGRFEDANPAALALYGYAPAELVRMKPEDLFDPVAGQTRHRKKDGKWFSAEVTSSRFQLGGRSLRTLSVRDVSAREEGEREQRALTERLRRAQKMEAIGRLAGGVAHDFSNLLAVVQAHADFIGEGLHGEHPARADLEGIQKATARGAALTQQLLLFGRTKAIEQASVSWNQVVLEVQKMLSRVLGPQVKLLAEPGPDLWFVRADPDQLGQVLVNLTINARDALPQGGTIRVRTENVVFDRPHPLAEEELPAGSYVRLVVADDGSGMPPEVMARLFEPFFTTKEVGKGTGLGLATVYGIVRASGGGLEVQSRPGAGSTFAVYLPACAPPLDQQPPAPRLAAKGRGETVLVVEDEPQLRLLVRRILEQNGYQVLEAAGATVALEAAEAHASSLRLLLSDVMMPGMDGRMLAARLRARQPGLRVLYMTGYPEAADQPPEEAHAQLIRKPFSTASLLAQVRGLLDTDEAAPADAPPGLPLPRTAS
ncbi:MAG: hypothetical protein NVSMB23_09820 [Myxococcales bacterium]